MNLDIGFLISLTLLALVALIGIFRTKTAGFGKYSTSLLLLTIVTFTAAIALITGQLSADIFSNVIFAIAGFAGGLVGDRSSKD